MSADTNSRRSVWSQLKPLVLRLHFYAGVLIAPFILIAAVTGLLYTVAPQVERAVYADQLKVQPAGLPLPLSEQVAAARKSHPDGDLVEVRAPVNAESSTRVVFTDQDVPTDYNMAVFVDPYNAKVLGEVRTFGQWLGVRAWLDDLHRNLHLGAVGRNYSELAASWLWVVVLGGVALWFTKRRRDRRLRRYFLPENSATGRRKTLSWHASIGVALALGAVLLSATGMTWSRFAGGHISELRDQLSWTGTSLDTSLKADSSAAGGHEHHHGGTGAADATLTNGVGIDGVMATARAQGLRDPLVLTPPADDKSAWSVAENKRSAPTRYDAIAVDPQSGQTVSRYDFASQPFMAKLTNWTIDAHMGILLGIGNQIVLAALAIGLITATILGYRAWWQRRPTRGRAWGRPPRRGAWRSLHSATFAVVIGLTLVVGWFAPLLGASFALFLAIDLLLACRQHRTSRTPQAPADHELPVEQPKSLERVD